MILLFLMNMKQIASKQQLYLLKKVAFSILRKLFLVHFLILLSINLNAQKKKEIFKSKEDGAFDVSEFLSSKTGFLPVPIIITEPAVGYGGGLVLAYFHNKKEGAEKPKGISPTFSFAGGAYTENGTWMAFAGHQGSYLNDRIRYLGAVGYVSPNLTFYRNKDDVFDGEYEFNLKGFFIFQEFLYRIKKEVPFFMGLNYAYFDNTINFKTGLEFPGLEELEYNTSLGGLNTSFLYDKRDNSFTPTKGINSALEVGNFGTYFGGDSDFWNIESRTYVYAPVVKDKLFSGYRLQIASKWGDVPFYARPFISLRGIPALRYQGENVLTAETEWRWNVVKRWSLVGFIGAGDAMKYYSDFGKNLKVAGGTGFRYLLAKQYGLHAGIDVARGPEDWTWNITVGSNWMR